MEDFENSPVLQKVLLDFVNLSEKRFREAVNREGKILTGEMINSIKARAVETGKGFIMAHVSYSEILRLKDVKQLNFQRTPPIEAMREYVESVGIENFGYVPGYKNSKPETETEAIERVSWGLKMARKTTPNVKRGYRGLYNDELKNYILPKFYYDMSQGVSAFALSQFRIMFNQ